MALNTFKEWPLLGLIVEALGIPNTNLKGQFNVLS